MIEAFEPLSVHHNVPGNTPGGIFGKVTMTKPVDITLSNRINEERKLLEETN